MYVRQPLHCARLKLKLSAVVCYLQTLIRQRQKTFEAPETHDVVVLYRIVQPAVTFAVAVSHDQSLHQPW